MNTIRIIVTGGTIDAEQYDFSEGKVISFGDPAVEKILQTGRVRRVFTETKDIFGDTADIFILPQKDSLDMMDDDRLLILRLCEKDPRRRILITHGTDTMQRTGALLAEKIKDKTIVLTGSMRPYYAENSDAAFNLGSALVACQTLPAGVYVVIQGEVFPVDKVKKIRSENDPHFESVN